MQENKMTEAQSLELITSMINDSRTRLARNSGTPFLIWGYTTVIVSILVFLTLPHWQTTAGWLWMLIPLIGWTGMIIFNRREKGATNFIDRVISTIWYVLGVSFFWVLFAAIFYHAPILFYVVLIAGIGTTMTRYIIRNKATKICGIMAMFSSLLFPLSRYLMIHFVSFNDAEARFSWINYETLLFAAIFFFMMVIPGHILNHKYNNK